MPHTGHERSRTVKCGANNRLYRCRIVWSKPNRLIKL
jgi:hypothetical protein